MKKRSQKINLDEEENKNNKVEENKDNQEDFKKQLEKDSEEQKIAQTKVDEIFNELDKIKREEYDSKKINPEEFEKDHDENGHIDFINAQANLRAKNYNITECDRPTTKIIAGKIIPAIASTTAAITDISCIQIYTLLQNVDLNCLRSGTSIPSGS